MEDFDIKGPCNNINYCSETKCQSTILQETLERNRNLADLDLQKGLSKMLVNRKMQQT